MTPPAKFFRHPQRLQRLHPRSSFRSIAANELLAQHLRQKFPSSVAPAGSHPSDAFLYPTANHIYNEVTGKRETIDSLLNGPRSDVWSQALSNEWGRLAQGNDAGVVFQDAIKFIPQSEVPRDRDVTYAQFVCDHRPLKTEPWRVRIVAGGDKLSYHDDPASPAASLLETKILINSVISDAKRGARFCTADLKDHFLGSPMERAEYMKVHISRFPPDIIQRYNLNALKTDNDYIYVKIVKGMYGLKQAALLAYNNIIKILEPHGYYPVIGTQGIWAHKTKPTRFCLCVDDFGIKYYKKQDVEHLLTALRTHYKATLDWKGENYCGLNIDWNYAQGFVDIDIKNYIKKLLARLNHPSPDRPVHSPHEWQAPVYGRHRQYADDPDTSPLLDKQGTKYVQSATGAALYYGRAIEHAILVALNDIGLEQAHPTQKTRKKVDRMLDFLATYPNGKIRYYASDMILHAESDAAYLVLPNAKSRIAGIFYLSSQLPASRAQIPQPKPNGLILVECKTLKHVVASAAEAETGGLFLNGQQVVVIRIVLDALGHRQPATPLKTDNSTAVGFANSRIKIKKSKSWDMRYNWLRCRENQNQLYLYWDKGSNNQADYFTKHFGPKHHIAMRPKFMHLANCIVTSIQNNFNDLVCNQSFRRRGCVDGQARVHLNDVTNFRHLGRPGNNSGLS